MDANLIKILLVEDNPGDARLIEEMLAEATLQETPDNFEVSHVERLAQAVAALAQQAFDLILLDLSLPDSHGLETVRRILEVSPELPLVVTSGLEDQTLALAAVKAGAQDYLMKGRVNEYSLSQAVRYALERKRSEEALRRSEEKLRLLFDILPVGIAILDQDRNVVRSNPALEKIVGLTKEGLQQKQHTRRRHLDAEGREMPPEQFPSIRAVKEQVSITDVEMGIVKEDGQIQWTNTSAVPVNLPDWKVVVTTTDISRRKRMEEALKRSEAFNRGVLSSLTAHIAVLDRQGEITAVNQAWERFAQENGDPDLSRTGPGLNYLEVCRQVKGKEASQAQAALAGIQAVLEGDQPVFSLEYPCHALKQKRWFVMRVTPLLGPEGGAVVAHEEITSRKLAEEEVDRRNRDLRLLNQIIAASAADPEPLEILEIACRELAATFELPHATATLLDETGAAAIVVAEYRTIEGPASLGLSFPVAQDPTLHYLRQEKAPLAADNAQQDPRLASLQATLEQNQVVSILVLPLLIEDEVAGSLSLETFEPHPFSAEEINLAWRVADQVAGALAQNRLAQTQQRLVAAIEQVTENIVVTDTQGKIIYVNPGFERLTGYGRAEVIGQNPRLLKSDQQKPEFYQELWATISAGQIWRGRLTNRKKNGSLYVEDMTITPVRDHEGQITNYVAVKRDVTRELQLEEQYHQAQKLEALGRLTGGIAHDFNNLLTAIIGFAELAYDEYPPDDPKQALMDKVLGSSRRAADLVRQLLVFSRKQVVEPRILNLNDIVSESNKMLERIIGEDIELQTNLASGLWPVKMDPSQVVQIIMNLAVNARDAMPEGGQLTIETANVVLDEDYTEAHLEVQVGEYALLAVTDTGVGMSKAVQARLFEPFFTTKEMDKGTGLGLATVYGIVEQNGGSIWVYSEEGQGTTFKIYLPRAAGLAARPAAAPAKEDLPVGHETILLVEDNEGVRSLFSNVLEAQGYTVIAAADGRAALSLVENQTQPIDLLLSDIVMPHLNGKVLAELLVQIYPHLKIIFMSGYTDHTVGNLPPEVAFLQKPFSPITLLRKVRRVLDEA